MQVDEGSPTFEQAQMQAAAPVLAQHAEVIQNLSRQMAAGAIEIGRRLAQCKPLVGHDNWLSWLNREFQWSERTAQNFMQVHELSLKAANIADLNLPVSALYQLAAPSTPEAVRDDILVRANAGEAFSVAEIRRLIDQARPDRPARDRYRDLRNLIAKMSRELPNDLLIEQLRTMLQ
jgi:hypothetical protein